MADPGVEGGGVLSSSWSKFFYLHAVLPNNTFASTTPEVNIPTEILDPPLAFLKFDQPRKTTITDDVVCGAGDSHKIDISFRGASQVSHHIMENIKCLGDILLEIFSIIIIVFRP